MIKNMNEINPDCAVCEELGSRCHSCQQWGDEEDPRMSGSDITREAENEIARDNTLAAWERINKQAWDIVTGI